MQPHTIVAYDAELKELDGLIGDMAGGAQSALEDATKALFAGDVRLAQQVIAGDASIDLLQHNIEEKAISTIATRQPVAIDLRQIVSAIRIANDLERIGDHATNIAETTHYLITGDMLSADRPKADESSGVAPSWGHTKI